MGNARRTLSRLCYAAAPSTRFFFTTGSEALVNQTPAAIPLDAQPRLPHGVRLVHNEAHGGWVLLAPERVFKADAIAAEIVKRCTGQATVNDIVDDLAKTFNAPRERIMTDVSAMLNGLVEKRLIEV